MKCDKCDEDSIEVWNIFLVTDRRICAKHWKKCVRCGKYFVGHKVCNDDMRRPLCHTREEYLKWNYPQQKKEKPMLSKEEKLEMIEYVDDSIRALDMIFGSYIEFCTKNNLLDSAYEMTKEIKSKGRRVKAMLLNKFIADDGVKGD